MKNHRTVNWLSGLLLAALLVATAIPAGAQPRERRPDPERGRRGERPEVSIEQLRQRGAERLQQLLDMDDEEWAAVAPMIEKVQELSRQAQGGAGIMPARGRDAEALPEVGQITRELRQLLADENTEAAIIEQKLTALRTARRKAAEELENARAELRELLTQRQEALLVMRGLLE